MKRVAELSRAFLCLCVVVGLFACDERSQPAADVWPGETITVAPGGELLLRCDRVEMLPGEVMVAQLLWRTAKPGDIDVSGVVWDGFEVVAQHSLPTRIDDAGGYVYGYAWELQAAAPQEIASQTLGVIWRPASRTGENVELRCTAPALQIRSAFEEGETIDVLPPIDTGDALSFLTPSRQDAKTPSRNQENVLAHPGRGQFIARVNTSAQTHETRSPKTQATPTLASWRLGVLALNAACGSIEPAPQNGAPHAG